MAQAGLLNLDTEYQCFAIDVNSMPSLFFNQSMLYCSPKKQNGNKWRK